MFSLKIEVYINAVSTNDFHTKWTTILAIPYDTFNLFFCSVIEICLHQYRSIYSEVNVDDTQKKQLQMGNLQTHHCGGCTALFLSDLKWLRVFEFWAAEKPRSHARTVLDYWLQFTECATTTAAAMTGTPIYPELSCCLMSKLCSLPEMYGTLKPN